MDYSNKLDETDQQIIDLLKKNSRMQWREIGEVVHLTGQAVANRIKRMEELGVIQGFTLQVNTNYHGKTITSFVTVIMKSQNHPEFHRFIAKREEVVEAHRISGDGCYWLRVRTNHEGELNAFLDELLNYGNYRLSLSIGAVKNP